MLDCGWWVLWHAALRLNPMSVEHLLITHCHHDHYAGFPIYYIIKDAPRRKARKRSFMFGDPPRKSPRLWSYPANSLRRSSTPMSFLR